MQYKILDNDKFEKEKYNIVSLRYEDIYDIKKWRNQQMDILRQKKKLTNKDQENYYKNQILPTFDEKKPKQILFSFLYNNTCIWYWWLTNVHRDDKSAELSFLENTNRTKDKKMYEKDFSIFISFMKELVFQKLWFNRLFTETYDIRPIHIKILEKNWFVYEWRMKKHVFVKWKYVDSLIHWCLFK